GSPGTSGDPWWLAIAVIRVLQFATSTARPLSWLDRPTAAAAVMPHRPRLCHCSSRYCCAMVRNALLMWMSPTFIRSALALAARNGSTALLVIAIPLPAENRVRLLGFMQLISPAICLD